MGFKIKARTLLHLGSDLISSDAIALFELIKNAFDAGSIRGVKINIVVRLPKWPGNYLTKLSEAKEQLKNAPSDETIHHAASKAERESSAVNELKDKLIADCDLSAPEARSWVKAVKEADSLEALEREARQANYITVTDGGHGMSFNDLTDVYLTIGTRYRRIQRQAANSSKQSLPILGEKGIGRLAVMRLGGQVRVETTESGETNWNLLEVDWSIFSHDSEEDLDSIEVAPSIGELKSDPDTSGTTIRISSLHSSWTKQTLKAFAREQASKLTDPFTPRNRYPIRLRFNNELVPVEEIDDLLFKHAHATLEAKLGFDDSTGEPVPRLTSKVHYRLRHKEQSLVFDAAQIVSTTGLTPQLIRSLGPFSVVAYWFNRQPLTKIEEKGIKISNLVNQWSGGLMLFRDGFRVFPYGSPDDDWLDLDRKALASGGYKVNRKQIVGKVDISSANNPALGDQTNREGLRDCPEKTALTAILRNLLEVHLRRFLNQVDEQARLDDEFDFDVLSHRVQREQHNLEANLRLLLAKYPAVRKETEIIGNLKEAVSALRILMTEAEEYADQLKSDHSQFIHLAGLGLMIETLIHELSRVSSRALSLLSESSSASPPSSTLSVLAAELKTLQKRLASLDPATTSGRQQREKFEIFDLVKSVVDGHELQLQRHKILCEIIRAPTEAKWSVHMVRGMLVQVLENLINNSIYWLKVKKSIDANFAPVITFELRSGSREILISDNGPGIELTLAEKIFQPFFTTKPPGMGKGLGLYIAQEIAIYHDATLRLSSENQQDTEHFNTFVLTLPEK